MKTILAKTLIVTAFITASFNAHSQTPQNAVYSEADKERILNKANYPLYKSDLKKVEELYEMYKKPFSIYEDSWEKIEYIKSIKDTLSRISKAYTDLWKVYLADAGKKEPLQQGHDDALGSINRLERELKNDYTYKYDPNAKAKVSLTEALELAEKKNEIFTTQSYKSDASEFSWKEVDERLNMGLSYISIFKLINGDQNSKLLELEKKKETTIAKIETYKTQFLAKVKELEMKELEGARLPKEKYMGADKEQIRKKIIAVNSSCTRYKLVKVIFPDQNWERNTGYEYNSKSQRDEKYDYNVLGIDIVIMDSKEPEIGYLIQGLAINKNNLTKTFEYEIPVGFICPDNVNTLHKVTKILMKNVK